MTPQPKVDQIPMVTGLSELAPRYDAILCDVWGVLIDGISHFRAAAAALKNFRAQGGAVLLITNASRPNDEVRRQLSRLGVPDDCFDDLVSAGELTLQEIVARAGQACHHLGPPRDKGLFEEANERLHNSLRLVGPDEADYVVCTGLVDEDHETPKDYDDRLAALKRRELPMLCANPDIVVGVGERLYWCAGSLARRYMQMGGETVMFGKPYSPIYRAALERLRLLLGNLEPNRVLAIGDGAETDLAGAGGAGLDCLFITQGVHRDELYGADGTLNRAALAALTAKAKTTPTALAREVVW